MHLPDKDGPVDFKDDTPISKQVFSVVHDILLWSQGHTAIAGALALPVHMLEASHDLQLAQLDMLQRSGACLKPVILCIVHAGYYCQLCLLMLLEH